MRKIVLLVTAPLAGLVLAAMATAGGGDNGYGYGTGAATTTAETTTSESTAGEETYTYRAILRAKQEVPAPKQAGKATGVFVGTVSETGGKASLRWTLTFRHLTGKAVAAHVHLGRRGVAGGVLEALCGPCRSGQSGTKVLSRAANDALEHGTAYVNVHTPTNPAGEIRGQVGAGAIVYDAALTSGQEVPRPKAAGGAKGRFTAKVVAAGERVTLAWKITYSGLTGQAVAAHIHEGRKGKAGGVIVSLCGPCTNGRSGKATLDDSMLKAIQSGSTYVNIHTPRNQAGELRGQVELARS